MSIYEKMKLAGVPTDNHESDLYAMVTPASCKIVEDYEYVSQVSKFTNQKDGKLWFDIKFAFDPFWESKPDWLSYQKRS